MMKKDRDSPQVIEFTGGHEKLESRPPESLSSAPSTTSTLSPPCPLFYFLIGDWVITIAIKVM